MGASADPQRKDFLMNLSENMYQLRRQAGLSQEELAGRLGVSRQAVSKWETGQAQPDLDKIVQLAAFYNISVDELLRQDDSTSSISGGQSVPPAVPADDETPSASEENFKEQEEEMQEDNASYTAQAASYYQQEGQVLDLNARDAESILATWKKIVPLQVVSIMTFILSPVVLIVLAGYSSWNPKALSENTAGAVGVCVLLLMVAFGVMLQLKSENMTKAFKPYKRQLIRVSPGLYQEYAKKRAAFDEKTGWKIAIPVCIFILAAMPVLFLSMWGDDLSEELIFSFYMMSAVGFLLVLISCGVGLIISRTVIQEGYDLILQKGDYTEWRKTHPMYSPAIALYWGIAAIIYLSISLPTHNWSLTWIVWIVASVIFPLYDYWLKTHLKAGSTRLNDEE